jgi:hypothetical protein
MDNTKSGQQQRADTVVVFQAAATLQAHDRRGAGKDGFRGNLDKLQAMW